MEIEIRNQILSLESMLVDFPMIRLATAEDNQRLLDFNNRHSMKTDKTTISYGRGDDFFEFYKMSGNQYWTFLFFNPDQTLGGFATMIRQWRSLAGYIQPVAYFCDLRISTQAHRQVHVGWRRFYAELIKELPYLTEDQWCATGYTAIFDENERAVRALREKLKGVVYTPIQKYKVRNILIPTSSHSKEKLIPMIISDEKALDFIANQNSEKNLALPGGTKQGPTLRQQWPGWDQYPFLGIAHEKELLAVVKPYVNSGSRQIKVTGLPRWARILGYGLRFFGRPHLEESSPLIRLEMTLLTFKRGLTTELKNEILREMTATVRLRDWIKGAHALSFTMMDGDLLSTPMPLGLGMDINAQIYEVHGTERSPTLLHSHIFFEGAIS